MSVLGLDTSNYTTSAALFDGETGVNLGRLLEVRPGELGLRQSDALFQHVKHLPQLLEQLEIGDIRAVGASTRPRAVEGSYMPCFLAGESQGRGIAAALGVPFYARPSWADYGTILATVPEAFAGDHVLYNGMEVYYNGVDTIAEKTRYAREHLGGIMIWELTQDAAGRGKSLLQAIGSACG